MNLSIGLLASALEAGLRLDNRSFNSYREFDFKCYHNHIETSLGHTLVSISTNVSDANADGKREKIRTEGEIYFKVTHNILIPHSERTFEKENYIVRVLETIFKYGRALDFRTLYSLEEGKVTFISMEFNIVVLNDDGNLVDCISKGVLLYLMKYFTSRDIKLNDLPSLKESGHAKLLMNHYPITTSFALLEKTNGFLVDPSYSEESYNSGSMVIVTCLKNLKADKDSDDIFIVNSKGMSVGVDVIQDCIECSSRISRDILGQIMSFTE